MENNAQAVSALLAALLILAVGTSVLLRSRSDRMYTSFAAFSFTVSAWHLCTFLSVATKSPVMHWLALWAAATIPPTAIRFFRIFLAQPSIGGPKRGPRVTLAWTLLAYAGLVVSAIYKPSRDPIHDKLYFQVPFVVYVFGGLYRCILDLYIQYRATAKRVERTRVGYLALGGFVAITLTLTGTLRLGVTWLAVGNVLGILYLYFLSQTLFRYRLIDLNELVGKMAVLGTLVVLLWAVNGFLLYWVGTDTAGGATHGSGRADLYLLNALVASFVILILFEPVRAWLETGINRWLLRQRTELRGRLDIVRRELPGVVDVPDMVQRILTALEESRRVTDASVYLLDADGAGFDRAGYIGQAPPERLDASAERQLLDRVRGGSLDKDQLSHELEELAVTTQPQAKRGPVVALQGRLDELHAGVIFPLLGSAETEQGPWLLGLFIVRDDRTETAFDTDDLDTFRQLAAGAARVIESSQAYERVKERDRLAALGEMAAGLAHEIRNPLGAIKGAAQLLITDGASTEAASTTTEMVELLDIIVEEANRLNNVVTRFLDYARSERPGREGAGKVDLNQVVRKTVQLLQQELPRAIELRVRIDEMLPSIAGDPESLMQVFLNLGQNALHAMPDGGTLEILTTRRRRSRLGYGQFAEVRFRDTGIGIPRDKLKKLFIPFYTTKQKGTGLGLAISHRIVNQHGGTIEVRSTLGQGSTFSVFLPAAEPIAASEVSDITETGGLRPIRPTDRGEAVTPPSAQPSAVATVGKRVESISPADSGSRAVATDDAGAPGDGATDAPGHPPPTDLPPIDAAFGDSPPATAAKLAPPIPVVPDEAAS